MMLVTGGCNVCHRSSPQSMVDVASENGMQAAKVILEQRPHAVNHRCNKR